MVDRHSTNGSNETAPAPGPEASITARDIVLMGTVLARKLNWAIRSTWNDRIDVAMPKKLLDQVVDRHVADIITEITINLPVAIARRRDAI